MISIIIPAYNEETVIYNCLAGLLPGIETDEFEVIVVCNACSDRTALVVRGVSKRIKCIEVEKASKTNAMNVGDSSAQYFPRVYMDADIRVSSADIVRMARVLEKGSLMAASPCMEMDMTHSTWIVRAYYDVWCNLPYCRAGLIGAGVIGLSEEGRGKFDRFPDIVADDGFIRLLFTRHERGVVDGAVAVIRAPSNLKGLIKITTRARLGGYELRAKFPYMFANDDKDYSTSALEMIKAWRKWPKYMVYLGINLLCRIRAKLYVRRIGFSGWERDESSRNISI